jgi:hypothetical protein
MIQPFVLPVEVKLFLTFLVTQGIKGLFSLWGKEISGGVSAFVAVLVGSMVFFIEGVISLFPPEQQAIAISFFGFVTVILGAFGAHKTYKGLSAR